MGGGPARIYPKANATTQWWETVFDRGTFSRIEKILLHTTETTGWPGYKAGASAPTLTYHPRLRAWRQHNYIDRSARALVDPAGTAVRENRDNVIQIEIIAYSDEKIAATVGGLKVSQLTDDHYRDLADFIAFVRREWGGPPLRAPKFIPYPGSYGNSTVRMTGPEYDAYQGLVGHMHASGNDHGDPSDIDAPKILRMVQAIEGGTTPTPAPVPEEDIMATKEELRDIVRAEVERVWSLTLPGRNDSSATAGSWLTGAGGKLDDINRKLVAIDVDDAEVARIADATAERFKGGGTTAAEIAAELIKQLTTPQEA